MSRLSPPLLSAAKQAVRWQLLPRNPAEAVDPLKEQPREMALWKPAEAQRFLEVAQGHRLYAAFYLAMSTGMRRGELLGLRWQDINGNLISIRQSLTVVKGQIVFSSPKTERSSRRIAVSPDVLEVLATQKQRQEVERAFLGAAWPETDLVFTSEVGTPLHPRNFDRTWHQLQAQAGVPRVRLHDLRHLHVSLLVKQGLDLHAIADWVGHTDPAFTLRRYSHLFAEQRQAAANCVIALALAVQAVRLGRCGQSG